MNTTGPFTSAFYKGSYLEDNGDFGYINYSLPFSGIVFIQLSDRLFMNTSLGGAIDF